MLTSFPSDLSYNLIGPDVPESLLLTPVKTLYVPLVRLLPPYSPLFSILTGNRLERFSLVEGALTQITYLKLSAQTGQNLLSIMPSVLATLTTLQTLDMSENPLLDGISDFVYNMTWLRVLYVSYLPPTWCLIVFILPLRILNNNPSLTGTLSPKLANMTSLTLLDVSNTGLTGTIPSGLSANLSMSHSPFAPPLVPMFISPFSYSYFWYQFWSECQ